VSEKAKLIRGDPPKIDFKKKGEPPKNEQNKLIRLKLLIHFMVAKPDFFSIWFEIQISDSNRFKIQISDSNPDSKPDFGF
jgi:hypothetical protein